MSEENARPDDDYFSPQRIFGGVLWFAAVVFCVVLGRLLIGALVSLL